MAMSEEQKAKMKAGRDRKRAEKLHQATLPHPEPAEPQQPEGKQVLVDESLIQQLIAKVAELEKQKNPEMTPEAALAYTATQQGFNTNVGVHGVQGRIFKYPIEKTYYPDLTERLYEEPALKRYNLRDNFLFDWDVEGVEYEKYNVTYAEPRFTVRLFRKIFNEDGVTPSGQMALINRAIVHEDEVVARAAMDKLGYIPQGQSDEQKFRDLMNEVRYYRFRTWLLDLFRPAQIEQHRAAPTQTVIDGKVVEVFDTEVLIDKSDAEAKSSAIQADVRI